MTRIRTGRALAAALGLALSLAVVGTQAQAAWADQPPVGGSDLATPIQSPYPTTQPTQPKWPITQVFPGDVLHPPTDPHPAPDPSPPDGPDDMATPTENPDPQPPTTTGPPAKPQPSRGATLVPTPERIDTGLGGTASQPDGSFSQPGVAGPVVMILLAAIAVAVLVLASICWRLTRSPR